MGKWFDYVGNKLQGYWHDFFVKFAPQGADDFVMTCKEAVEYMSLNESPSFIVWIRLRFHLSLCKACLYYFKASKVLKNAVRGIANKSSKFTLDIEKLNNELLRRYAQLPKLSRSDDEQN